MRQQGKKDDEEEIVVLISTRRHVPRFRKTSHAQSNHSFRVLFKLTIDYIVSRQKCIANEHSELKPKWLGAKQ